MAKRRYQCPCGRVFEKQSAAESTGLWLQLEGEDADCRGCPFIEPVIRWNGGLKQESLECRAGVGEADYRTRAFWRPGDATVVRVATLDLDWLEQFIAAWREEETPFREIDPADPAAWERYFRSAARDAGRRVYSFHFRANRAGLRFKAALMARFFGPDGIALRSRGPEADRQAVLDQIARRKEQARIVQYLCDHGEETRGKTAQELHNMYDGYLLRDRLRAGKDPPETADAAPQVCPHYRGVKKDPYGRCWQIECAVSLDPHVYGYEQKSSAQHNAKGLCLSGAEHPECRYFTAAKEKGVPKTPESEGDQPMTKQPNSRCPLQPECERKCAYQRRELDCEYYRNNARPGYEISDQEERRDRDALPGLDAAFDEPDEPEEGELQAPEEDGLQEAVAPPRPLADITAEIRFYKAQTVSNFLEIGRRLIEAKAQLAHGQWLVWLEKEADFSERTAQNFMRLAEGYPNPQPVADLSYSKCLALLAVPTDERQAFLEAAHEVGGEEKTVAEMSRRELEQVIRERDEARRIVRVNEEASLEAAAEKAQLSRDLRELKGKLRGAQDREASLSRQNLSLGEKIRALEARPVEVAVAEPSPERIAEIRREGYEQARAELAAAARPAVLLEEPLPQAMEIVEGAVSLLIAAAGQSAGEGDRMLMAGMDALRRQVGRLEEARERLASALRLLEPGAGDVDW